VQIASIVHAAVTEESPAVRAEPTPSGRQPLLRSIEQLVIVAAGIFVVGLVAGLTLVGRHGGGAIQSLDRHVWRAFIDHRFLVGLDKVIATIGDASVLGIICAVVSIALLARRRSPTGLAPLVGFLGGEAQVFFIREVIHRPRPVTANFPAPGALRGVNETTWSFPSGHATTVTAVLLASLGAWALTRRIVWPWVVGGLVSIYVAISRLVLGVHWLSDVVVGLVLGAAWGVSVAIVLNRLTWDELRYAVPPMRKDRPRHATVTATSDNGPVSGP
jgi:membrane-associated phospholipid phosphatase